MTPAERRFFSGNSLEQALVAAACHYDIEPENIAYRTVEKRHGFLRIRRRVVIEVDPAAPRKRPGGVEVQPPEGPQDEAAPPVSEERPGEVRPRAEEKGEAEPIDAEGTEAAVRRAAERLLHFARLNLEVAVRPGEDGFQVELSGADRGDLVAEDGILLHAFDQLLPRVARGVVDEPVLCRVDSGGYRQAREEELRQLARDAAGRVRRAGRAVSLPPLPPAERRIVHLTLADDPEVTTESEGRGYFRRVSVRPGGVPAD